MTLQHVGRHKPRAPQLYRERFRNIQIYCHDPFQGADYSTMEYGCLTSHLVRHGLGWRFPDSPEIYFEFTGIISPPYKISEQNLSAEVDITSYTAPRFEKGQQSQTPTEGVGTRGTHVSMEEAVDTPPLKYQYRPLTSPHSTRLIELLPGSGSDPISCSLRPVNLEDAQPFEALSYIWGRESDKRAVFCFDHGTVPQSKNSTLGVTLNCWHALHRLRFEDKSRHLWIDAICINQEDRKERSQQVSLMGNLYRMANCVLVYLKSYNNNVHISIVFKLTRELANQGSRFPEGMGIGHSAFGGMDYVLVI